jgi:hypothetical protein
MLDLFKKNSDVQLLRKNFDCSMAPLPAWGILTDWPEPGIHMCACGECGNGANAGKHPHIRWTGFTRPDWFQVEEWLCKFMDLAHPLNWAYHLGASGLAGLDMDPRNGGAESWTKVLEEFGPLPATPKDAIVGRGFHLWFRAPAEGVLPATTHFELFPGLELKHGNGYFFGPPSTHRCGERYRWQPGSAPWETPFAPLPQWIIDRAWELEEKKKQKQALVASGKTTDYQPRTIHVIGVRGDQQQVYERARRYMEKIPPGIAGQGGSKPCYRAACALVLGFDLSVAEALPLLQEYSARCLPPWSDKELLHKLESASKASGERGYLLIGNHYGALEAELAEFDGVEFEFIRPDPRGYRQQQTPEPSFDPKELFTDEELRQLEDVMATNPSRQFSAVSLGNFASQESHPGNSTEDSKQFQPPACHVKVFVKHKTEPRARILFVSCMRWCCLHCAPRLKQLWTANVLQRLAEDRVALGEPNGFVWQAHCDLDRWPTMHKRIQRQRGNYFRVRDGSRYLVVATVDPGDGLEVSHKAAGDALVKVIESLPLCEKPISSSRAWKLIKEKGSGQWQRLGEIPRSVTTERIRQILRETGLEFTDMPVKDAPTIRHILEIKLPHDWGMEGVRDFYFWLCEGETVPPEIMTVWPQRQQVTPENGELDLALV